MTEPIVVRTTCRICGKAETICVDREDWDTFNSPHRPLIQDIFPYLFDYEREMLISGTCVDCWNEMFGEWEDEE